MSRDGERSDYPGAQVPRAWQTAQRLQRAANDDAPNDAALPAYAELHCLSDFSFLRGASSAEDLFLRAQHCGYEALAITDECSLAGIVRGLEAARATGIKLIVGSEFTLACGLKLVLLVETMAGYTRLCELITRARRAVDKKGYRLCRDDVQRIVADVAPAVCGLFALWVPASDPDDTQARWLRGVFGERACIAVGLHREQDDDARLQRLLHLAHALSMTPVASGDVHMAERRQRALHDTMTAIRNNTTLADCGARLFRNGERHLRSRRALGNIYASVEGGHALLQNAVEIARRCRFDLGRDLDYRYPVELVPDGHTPTTWLRERTERGMRERWPEGTPPAIVKQIDDELALIAELRYEAFFLTVDDIVRFANSQDILCQGRGSSANSAVCYALGITAVNPAETRLLIARFLSRARTLLADFLADPDALVLLTARGEHYVEAAATLGSSPLAIMWRHLMPSTVAPLIIQGTYIAASAILTEATLSFLGAGIGTETPSWGNIMSEGRLYFLVKPALIFWPGLVLSLCILSINILGDELRDLLDPHQKTRKA